MPDRHFTTRDGEKAIVPDMAEMMDLHDEAGRLAEELGCSRAMADRVRAIVVQREDAAVRARVNEELLKRLRPILAELAVPGNIQVRVWALLFAAKAFDPSERSMAKKAEDLGVTRADLSHFVVRWQTVLGITDNTYARGESASENSRIARERVLNEGPQKEGRRLFKSMPGAKN